MAGARLDDRMLNRSQQMAMVLDLFGQLDYRSFRSAANPVVLP